MTENLYEDKNIPNISPFSYSCMSWRIRLCRWCQAKIRHHSINARSMVTAKCRDSYPHMQDPLFSRQGCPPALPAYYLFFFLITVTWVDDLDRRGSAILTDAICEMLDVSGYICLKSGLPTWSHWKATFDIDEVVLNIYLPILFEDMA